MCDDSVSNGTKAASSSCVYSLQGDTSASDGTPPGEKALPPSSDSQLFQDQFDEVVAELTERDLTDPALADALTRLRDVLVYNAPGGKRHRGLSVIGSLRKLVGDRMLDADAARRALLVGWCVELLQAFFLVADDIMDGSATRRGAPCWYAVDGVGLEAVNDAFLLEHAIYRLLRRHCRGERYYVRLLELFTETSYRTALGQSLDLTSAARRPNDGPSDLDGFTVERYKAIAKYKTAFYSFYLPVAAAMHMAGVDGEAEHAGARRLLLEMGEFFQTQDDFLDCYGDPAVTGKAGTDIQDGKCSWLVVTALRGAAAISAEQRAELAACYGRRDHASVATVKRLYDELRLPALYRRHEEESYRRLTEMVARHAPQIGLPPDVFLDFAEKIYKRKK